MPSTPFRVLIVDDDDLLRDLLSFRLEAAGFEVRWAGDGEAGLHLAKTEKPDLVVLDSMLPVLTGPEVLRSLKQDCDTRPLPVIMLTARKGQTDIVEALRAGAADYLTKPFLPDELIARVMAILDREGRTRAHSDAA